MDPAKEQQWLDEQESIIGGYLKTQNVTVSSRGRIEWCLAPYVSLWSFDGVGTSRVWAISGDLPTDYVVDLLVTDARTAMQALAARWAEVSAFMLKGKHHPTVVIGANRSPEELKELGDLLRRRADLLEDFAGDDDKWASGL
jgi:hypothetical protein